MEKKIQILYAIFYINQDFINQNKTCTQIAIYTIEIFCIQYYSL